MTFPGVRTIADQVAKAIDLGNVLALNVGQDGLEGLQVAVDVANQGSFHAAVLVEVGSKPGTDTNFSAAEHEVLILLLRQGGCGSAGAVNRKVDTYPYQACRTILLQNTMVKSRPLNVEVSESKGDGATCSA